MFIYKKFKYVTLLSLLYQRTVRREILMSWSLILDAASRVFSSGAHR